MKLRWIDIAKGLAIFLVVLGHARSKVFVELEGSSVVVDIWSDIDGILPIIRMPLFFVVSGVLAAKAVRRPWRSVVRPRIFNIYWVYALWLILGAIVFRFFQGFDTNVPRSPGRLIFELLFGTSYLWYLYALIMYFVLIKFLYRFSAVLLVMGAIGCLVISAELLPFHLHGNVESMVRSFIFFALGVYFSGYIKYLVDARAILMVLGGSMAGTAMLLTADASGAKWLNAFASAALLMAILGLCKLSSQYVPRVAEYAGRNTLPVYVMHMPLLAVCHALIEFVPSPLNSALLAGFPVLLALLVMAVCLGVYELMVRSGLGFMFRLPGGAHHTVRVETAATRK